MDPKKNRENRRRHKVSFEEAETAFADEHGLLMADPEHSENESRFILLGLSATLRLLVVCHTYREEDEVIRLDFGPQGGPVRAGPIQQTVETMRKHYDFSQAKPNPYAKRLKKEVTLRLDERTVNYFEELSEETGIPPERSINLYLRECAASRKRLALQWKPAA